MDKVRLNQPRKAFAEQIYICVRIQAKIIPFRMCSHMHRPSQGKQLDVANPQLRPKSTHGFDRLEDSSSTAKSNAITCAEQRSARDHFGHRSSKFHVKVVVPGLGSR